MSDSATTSFVTRLEDRGVVSVGGVDAEKLLQGLLTSDVAKLQDGRAAFAALLSPQGKIQFDFFVLRAGERFLIDVARALVADLVKRLTFYKLRAKVEITDISDQHAVFACWGATPTFAPPGHSFQDPRLPAMGWRAVHGPDDVAATSGTVEADAYHAHRIALGIPEGGRDFAFGEAFPHEADMDQLGGIDFKKGCYIGQEVVSRMQHRGTARARLVPVIGNADLPAAGTALLAGETPIGTLGSVSERRGIAMVRLDRLERGLSAGEQPMAGGIAISILQPSWAKFDVPQAGAEIPPQVAS